MEKEVEKLTLNEKWKARFIKITPEELKIYKNKDDKEPKQVISIVGCRTKKLKHTLYNKPNVFKIDISTKRFIFSAKSESERKEIMSFLYERTQRASLIASKVNNMSSSRRGSISVFTRQDLRANDFNIKKYTRYMDKAFCDDTTQENQLNFAKLCAQFMSTAHQSVESISKGEEIDDIKGIKIEEIDPQSMDEIRTRMYSLSLIAKEKIQGLYVPLLSVFNAKGKTYLASLNFELSRHPKISASSKAKLLHLSYQLGISETEVNNLEYTEDFKGRLWITDASMIIKCNENQYVHNFIEKMNSFELFTFETGTLNEELQRNFITQQYLPTIAQSMNNQDMKQAIEIEMIAICCASIFRKEYQESDDYKQSILKFINKVVINDMVFWNTKLAQEMNDVFGYLIPPKVLIPKTLLFFALQRRLGVDMNDSPDYTFNDEFTTDQVVFIHVTHENSILELCEGMRNINYKESPFVLYSKGLLEDAISMLNERASLVQVLYGEQNPTIAITMSLLSLCYIGTKNMNHALMCSDTFKNTDRENHGLYAVTALATKDFETCEKIVNFHFGPLHLFNCVFYKVAAEIQQQKGNFEKSLEYINKSETLNKDNNDFHDSIIALKIKLLMILKKNEDYMKLAKGITNEARKDLTMCSILYSNGMFDESIKYGLKSYEFYSQYPNDLILLENLQILANIFDIKCDYRNAYAFYDALYAKLYSFQTEDKEDLTKTIAKNIIRLFFKEKAQTAKKEVISIKEKAKQLNKVDDSFINEILSKGPREFAFSAKEEDLPKLYQLIM